MAPASFRVTFLRRFWVTFSAWVIGSYASGLNRFRITGAENIPSPGGVLLASNHISAYDTILLPWALLRHFPFRMVWAPAKEELFRGFPGFLYSSWGAFPVKRGRDVRAAGTISDLLRDQRVMLFPEGTRHRDGRLGAGNRGVGKIIYDTRVAVVPVALSGINAWKFPRLGQRGGAAFGKPIDFSDLFQLEDTKETHILIVNRVMDAIEELLRREGAFVGRS